MGKATPAKKGKSSTAVAAPEPRIFKGWATLAEFLLKGTTKRQSESSDTTHLIHIISCSEVNRGFQAEVNWYTGGTSFVTLPNAVAEKKPGVYLAKAKHIRWLDLDDEDRGPQTPSASITHLRRLGTRSQFVKMADEKGTAFGKKKYERLMEMLTFNVDDSVSDADGSETGNAC